MNDSMSRMIACLVTRGANAMAQSIIESHKKGATESLKKAFLVVE